MHDGCDSITIYDHEREDGLVDPGLDFGYIDGVAADIAAILAHEPRPAEVCYQPGDDTRYPLVFVPLVTLINARPRVVDGVAWEQHAVSGMANKNRSSDRVAGAEFYEPHGYLVVWVDHAAYPLRLGDRGVLASGYIAEHWKTGSSDRLDASAVSLAILFRAISHYLDKWASLNDPAAPKLKAV